MSVHLSTEITHVLSAQFSKKLIMLKGSGGVCIKVLKVLRGNFVCVNINVPNVLTAE